MMSKKFTPYDLRETFAKQASALLSRQIEEWPALKEGVSTLSQGNSEDIEVEPFRFKKLFNPARIVNIKADVSKEGIAKRKCFLCVNDLPEEQRGIEIENFLLLCNPRPIFRDHFTLSCLEHVEQTLAPHIDFMSRSAKFAGSAYTIFFNGAQAGASAPDHLHFQVCPTADLPLMQYLCSLPENVNSVLSIMDAGYVSFTETKTEKLKQKLSSLIEAAKILLNCNQASMNILMTYKEGSWLVVLVPRKKHRPACFSATGEEKILLSPAAVETSGAIVASQERDFDKIDEKLLQQVWSEIYFTTKEVKSIVLA